jgi:hypothetical protein
MDWSHLFEYLGKAVSTAAAVAGAWWAIEKWRKRYEHFPRVYFEVAVNFIGIKDEQILVELVATLENRGVVPLKIRNFTFKLLGIKESDTLERGGKEILGGHLKTGQSRTGQNRPVRRAPQARGFYRIGGRVRKSAVTGGIAAGPVGDDAEAAAGRK